MLYKNVAAQKVAVFAYTFADGLPKTGDAANITAYLSKDFGAAAQTNDVNPTELDATNMPGWYVFDLTQAETNAEVMVLAAKSVTADVICEQLELVTQDASIASRAAAATALSNATWTDARAGKLDNLDATVSSRSTYAGEAVASVTGDVGGKVLGGGAGAITGTGVTAQLAANQDVRNVSGNVAGSVGSVTAGVALAVGQAGNIADSVWDEAIAGHLGAGTTGNALNAAGSAGDPWSTPLPGAYGAGTAGKIIGDNVNAPVGTVDTVVDAIKAKTDNLPAAPAATGDVAAGLTAYGAAKPGDSMGVTAAGVDAVLDEVVEGALTFRQMLRLFLAALAGKADGGGTATIHFRDSADSKNRITLSVDASGNRSASVLDAS